MRVSTNYIKELYHKNKSAQFSKLKSLLEAPVEASCINFYSKFEGEVKPHAKERNEANLKLSQKSNDSTTQVKFKENDKKQ